MKRYAAIILALLATGWAAVAQAQPAPPADIAGFINASAAENDLHGVIRVEENGALLFHGAYGQANRAFAAPTMDDTRFRIASITKLFTAVLILQLQDEGRLSIDDTVDRHLPDLPGEAGARVTLRQLLNHTSGLTQLDTVSSYQEAFANGIPHYQRPMTPAALLANCCTGALATEPGTAFNYNNADYILLGAVIEGVTGKGWEQVLSERILTPLALADTGVARWDAIVERLAPTYTFRDDTRTLVTDMPVYFENWSASGAMYSTAADLAVFADALYGGRLLKPASLDQLLTPGLDDYGLSVWSYSFERGGRTWHVAQRPGGVMGATGVLYRLRERGVTIVLLSNTNAADLDVFARRIANWLIDSDPPAN